MSDPILETFSRALKVGRAVDCATRFRVVKGKPFRGFESYTFIPSLTAGELPSGLSHQLGVPDIIMRT